MTDPVLQVAGADERDAYDPKGLIRESYRIDGITTGECKSILMDWALSLSTSQPAPQALAQLLDRYGTSLPDHPMTALLRAGLDPLPTRPTRSRDPARRRARPLPEQRPTT